MLKSHLARLPTRVPLSQESSWKSARQRQPAGETATTAAVGLDESTRHTTHSRVD